MPAPVTAQPLDVERRGTIPDVRIDRGGLMGGGRAELTLQVDYLYRASSLMGEAVVNCGLRVRDMRGTVTFEHRGKRVRVAIDGSNEKLVSVSQALFMMDFQVPGQMSRLGLRCGEGVIARAGTEPFNVAGSPSWRQAFCRYPDPGAGPVPDAFGIMGWCTGLRGDFIDREDARAIYRDPLRHQGATPVVRSMSIGIGDLITAWARDEVAAEEVTGEEPEAARRTRDFMARLNSDFVISRARAEAERARRGGADLDAAHARAIAQCEAPTRPQPPPALVAAERAGAAGASAPAGSSGAGGAAGAPARPAGSGGAGGASDVVSLVLLIDVSGSMRGNRIDAARRAAIETVRRAARAPNTEFAVFSFTGDCGSPRINSVGFGRDAAAAVRFIEGLRADGGTPLGPAISRVNRYIAENRAPGAGEQMVILLADGDDSCNSVGQELDALRRAGILFRHDTIGLEVSGNAASTLRRIATESGGSYRDAASPQAVAGAFEAVVGEMDRRNRTRAAELERLRTAHARDVAAWQTSRDRCIAVANNDLEKARAEAAAAEARAQEARAGLRAILDRRRGVDAAAVTGVSR